MSTSWTVTNADALLMPIFYMFLSRPFKGEEGLDDWELMPNNILRISRRFYQAEIDNGRLRLQAYAVCAKRIATVSDCIKTKVIAKPGDKALKGQLLRRMDVEQREDFSTYTTIELLKIVPSENARFKLKGSAKSPDYDDLLKSSQHLASQVVPDILITDSVMPIYRGKKSVIKYRTADKLKLALSLGFGRWLIEKEFDGRPACDEYIESLSKRNAAAFQKNAKKVLQDYCGDNKAPAVSKAFQAAVPMPGVQAKPQPKVSLELKHDQTPAQRRTQSVTKPQEAKPSAPGKKPARILAGCWRWSNGAYIVVKKDGSLLNGIIPGSWKTVDEKGGRYSITWPPITDTLALSKDGSALSGVNIFGMPVSAKRVSGDSGGLEGQWLWMNGIQVAIATDKTVVGGSFKGSWHKSGQSYVIEWPIIDDIRLSGNQASLKGRNQFGEFTAERDSACAGP